MLVPGNLGARYCEQVGRTWRRPHEDYIENLEGVVDSFESEDLHVGPEDFEDLKGLEGPEGFEVALVEVYQAEGSVQCGSTNQEVDGTNPQAVESCLVYG